MDGGLCSRSFVKSKSTAKRSSRKRPRPVSAMNSDVRSTGTVGCATCATQPLRPSTISDIHIHILPSRPRHCHSFTVHIPCGCNCIHATPIVYHRKRRDVTHTFLCMSYRTCKHQYLSKITLQFPRWSRPRSHGLSASLPSCPHSEMSSHHCLCLRLRYVYKSWRLPLPLPSALCEAHRRL